MNESTQTRNVTTFTLAGGSIVIEREGDGLIGNVYMTGTGERVHIDRDTLKRLLVTLKLMGDDYP